ncbi:SPFH domain-containing protein [Pseudomonas aeruginosa]|uniref:SPFH domain-containing protein n=1 Tax=Pseudomonas aeruginosa TaxID=287 RepID=UPI00105360FE|nr:SPFH domain-containing protein [Pseudomonas aeruginosa]
MRVDLDAEGVAAESLPRFQQAPRQLRQLWRWAAASVALAAACAVLGFFIGLFAADSLWPPLLYNLGAAWLVLFAGLHAAYRVAAWRCVVLGAEASARPAWLRWQRGEPDAAADSAYERLLERLGQAIAHGLAQLGHAALWLAASAALALCLVAAGWRLDLPPASSGQAADLAIGICLLLAFAVLVLERRFASQGPAQWPEAPALGQLARALIGTLVLAALCLFLARQGHPWAPRLAVLLGLLPAALALELLGRAILAMFAPQRAGLEPRLVATSLLADLLRWPPRPLQRLQHELHQRFGIDLRQVWAFGFMRRAFLPVLAVVSLSGWLLSGVREIGMDALDEVLGEQRAGLAEQIGQAVQADLDRLGSGVEVLGAAVEAIHPPAGAANAYHAVQAAQITAQALIARERGQAAAQRNEAQLQASVAHDRASAQARETLAAAQAADRRFAAEREGYADASQAFLLEAYYRQLGLGLGKANLLLIDHRIAGAGAPTIDLRSFGLGRLDSPPSSRPSAAPASAAGQSAP